MFVCWAQVWAAWRMTFCQFPARLDLLLKVENRLLETPPPRFVPSGMKLIVMSWGFGQMLPEAE